MLLKGGEVTVEEWKPGVADGSFVIFRPSVIEGCLVIDDGVNMRKHNPSLLRGLGE
jgi:hypothetical protein